MQTDVGVDRARGRGGGGAAGGGAEGGGSDLSFGSSGACHPSLKGRPALRRLFSLACN